jgi:hypothetical protein
MIAMDGNNSLKRIAQIGNRAIGDIRVFDSDYFLSRNFVDGFVNEVKGRQPSDGNQDNDDQVPQEEGDLTDGDNETTCAVNWKAAAADEKKTMWGIFEESGFFASACRHGFILWMTDMVRSGEL